MLHLETWPPCPFYHFPAQHSQPRVALLPRPEQQQPLGWAYRESRRLVILMVRGLGPDDPKPVICRCIVPQLQTPPPEETVKRGYQESEK